MDKRRGRLAVVRAPDAFEIEPQPDEAADALATLLPEGAEVQVAFFDEDRRTLFRRAMWIIRFKICEGPHEGKLISWWLRALDRKRRVARGSGIATSFSAATGLRPPRDLDRYRPSSWLAEAVFLAKTRQVRKDVLGVARAEEASYSVVVGILERIVGMPPALRERR
jgi:hypothetical protein